MLRGFSVGIVLPWAMQLEERWADEWIDRCSEGRRRDGYDEDRVHLKLKSPKLKSSTSPTARRITTQDLPVRIRLVR